jgi:hypothetical protein
MPNKTLLVLSVSLLVSVFLTACTSSTPELQMASLDSMPANVQSAPPAVQQAYQFAVANPDVLQHLPCYCGCGAMGHTSNYMCYVSGEDAQGQPMYDEHALGCSICVDITQDAMRLMRDGKPLDEIKSYIDLTYAQYGPTNMP